MPFGGFPPSWWSRQPPVDGFQDGETGGAAAALPGGVHRDGWRGRWGRRHPLGPFAGRLPLRVQGVFVHEVAFAVLLAVLHGPPGKHARVAAPLGLHGHGFLGFLFPQRCSLRL